MNEKWEKDKLVSQMRRKSAIMMNFVSNEKSVDNSVAEAQRLIGLLQIQTNSCAALLTLLPVDVQFSLVIHKTEALTLCALSEMVILVMNSLEQLRTLISSSTAPSRSLRRNDELQLAVEWGESLVEDLVTLYDLT